MKCYNHPDRDAFGICRICGKALCLECMDKNSEHVLCADSQNCIDRDKMFEKYYQNTNVIYSAKSIAKIKVLGIFLCIFGVLLSIISFLSQNFDGFLFGMGLFILVLGIANIRRAGEFVAVEDSSDRKNVESNIAKYIWIIVAIIVIVFTLSLFLTPIQ